MSSNNIQIEEFTPSLTVSSENWIGATLFTGKNCDKTSGVLKGKFYNHRDKVDGMVEFKYDSTVRSVRPIPGTMIRLYNELSLQGAME